MEYSIPGLVGQPPMQGEKGRWEEAVAIPKTPGRHLLTVRFTGENGAVTLAHTVFKVPGQNVREAWSKDLGSAVMGAPAIWRDLAIVPTVEKGVIALRLSDGKEVWRRKVEGQARGRVAVEGDMAYFGAGKTVYALAMRNPENHGGGRRLGGTIVAGVTVSGGKLYVPAGEHTLFCLDILRGNVLWNYTVGLPIIMEPAVEGNRVFFGANGRVYSRPGCRDRQGDLEKPGIIPGRYLYHGFLLAAGRRRGYGGREQASGKQRREKPHCAFRIGWNGALVAPGIRSAHAPDSQPGKG